MEKVIKEYGRRILMYTKLLQRKWNVVQYGVYWIWQPVVNWGLDKFETAAAAAAAKFYQNPIFKSSFAIVVIRLENYVPCGDADDVMGCSEFFSETNFLCVFNFGDLILKSQIHSSSLLLVDLF